MKTKKRYYNLCVEVLYYDKSSISYKLWYIETFSSKRNFKIWSAGLHAGLDRTVHPHARRIGKTFVKYLTIPPRY